MTEIIWSAIDRDGCTLVKRETAVGLPMRQFADVIAGTVLKHWLNEPAHGLRRETNWDEVFGADETEAEAFVIIHEPEPLRGVFEVQLERKVSVDGSYQVARSDLDELITDVVDDDLRAEIEAAAKAAEDTTP